MKYELEFELPGLPKSLNEIMRAHMQVQNNHARLWKRAVWAAVCGKKPSKPLESCWIELVRFNYRFLDFDGLVGSFKHTVDGLVEAGILKNDTYKITGPWKVWQEYCPKAQARIKVRVYE